MDFTAALKLALKVAAADRRTWKAFAVLISTILTPFILIIVMIMSLMSAASEHNNAAVDLAFHGGYVPAQAPPEYRQYIEDMQDSFSGLDSAVSEIASMVESGSIDTNRIKSIFYSLYFGAGNLRMNQDECREFAGAFVRYEERTRTVTGEGGEKTEETYIVAIPIYDLSEVYSRLESILRRTVTEENRVNAAQIYSRVLYGHSLPRNESIGQDEWQGGAYDGGIYTGGGDFASPLGADWRGMVTSEFGWRADPFGGSGGEGHYGIDLAALRGTSIRSAREGVVSYVKNSGSKGYGLHVAVDHGDGMVTLYAHCSRVYVRSGQSVRQGDIIAAVGSTGRSTGNHLHLEVRINGAAVNPRKYLQ